MHPRRQAKRTLTVLQSPHTIPPPKKRYSHDIATIVNFNSREKGICFDYLRNQCHRGLLCRFSHDLSNIAQQCQVRGRGAAPARLVCTVLTEPALTKSVCSSSHRALA